MAELIQYGVDGGIATLTLHDPPANTYSYEMMRELDRCILDARMDASVHAIVITGAGEKFFCAGATIGMLRDADPNYKYYFCLHANETLNRLEQTPKLVIAALNGHTVGGGLEVAMAADLRIARKDAGKIIRHLKGRGIHTAMNTNGWFVPAQIEDVALLDLVCVTLDGLPIPEEPDVGERFAICLRHARNAIAFERDPEKGVFEFRKHLGWYTKGLPDGGKLRQKLFAVRMLTEVEELLEGYLDAHRETVAAAT